MVKIDKIENISSHGVPLIFIFLFYACTILKYS